MKWYGGWRKERYSWCPLLLSLIAPINEHFLTYLAKVLHLPYKANLPSFFSLKINQSNQNQKHAQ